MSFTRFHDDPARIRKQLHESSFSGRYFLNTPGQGVDLPFQEDPQIRLQGWGANMRTNAIHLESDLRGLTRPLNRDLADSNLYTKHSVSSVVDSPMPGLGYRNAAPFVEESRASHPAWMYRDLEQPRWINPLLHHSSFIKPSSIGALEKGFPHLNIYNGTPSGRLNRDLRATLPINELKGNPLSEGSPILNLHRCQDSIQTRILEKDYFVPRIPIVDGTLNQEFYLSGQSVCVGGMLRGNGHNNSCPQSLYENRIR